jgi:protein-tyrosine phosphatase
MAAGIPTAPPGRAPPPPQVLLVCTANICRSPMAEVLWREAAAGRPRAPSVASCGIAAEPDRPADPTCIELMAQRGLDLAAHRAARFDPNLAVESELVLVMEPSHQRRIHAIAPLLAGRVQLLGRWTDGPIEDPYRRTLQDYENCMVSLEKSVAAWLNKLP